MTTKIGKCKVSSTHRRILTASSCALTFSFLIILVAKAGDRPQMIQIENSDVVGKEDSSSQRRMQINVSGELADNRIGGDYGSDHPGSQEGIYKLGLKWLRLGFWDSSLNWQQVESRPGKYSVPAERDAFVRDMVENGVTIVLCLGVGSGKNRPDTTRFRTDDDIVRYTNYVRFMVEHFKRYSFPRSCRALQCPGYEPSLGCPQVFQLFPILTRLWTEINT